MVTFYGGVRGIVGVEELNVTLDEVDKKKKKVKVMI